VGFIDRPKLIWWRKAFFQIHLWTGVVIGLYVIAISLSGSILVFQREFENDAPRLNPHAVTSLPNYDAIVAAAVHAHPNDPLESIDLRSRERRIVPVELKSPAGTRIVYVDATTFQIVHDGVLQQEHRVTQFLMSLHNELLGGRNGATVNGVCGILLFTTSFTGLILWWPGKNNWKRALKVKWNARWVRLNWDLHSVFGFWALLFVAMWGITGAYFIWPQQVRSAVSMFAPMSHFRERPSTWNLGDPIQPVSTFIASAQQRYPQSQLAYVYLDVYRPGGAVKVFLSHDPAQSLAMNEDVVSFQPATMEVLSDVSTAKLTFPERLSLAVYSIHFGDFAGRFGKILWCLIGLIPAALSLTGYLMWWNRVLKKWTTSKLNQLTNQ
jgi:uncharacterized iron-regulated membrane protein